MIGFVFSKIAKRHAGFPNASLKSRLSATAFASLLMIFAGCALPAMPLHIAGERAGEGADCREITRIWRGDLATRKKFVSEKISEQSAARRGIASVKGKVVKGTERIDLASEALWARKQLTEWNRWSDSLGRRGDALSPAIVSLVKFHAASEIGDLRLMNESLGDAATRLEKATRTLCGKP